MSSHTCVKMINSLFGPTSCGRTGVIYDRVRKGWLCSEHGKEWLCEFCQANPMWGRICYQGDGVAREIFLCCSCAGLTTRKFHF